MRRGRGGRTIQGPCWGGTVAEQRRHQGLAALRATFSLALLGRLFSDVVSNEGEGTLALCPAGGSGCVLQEGSSFLAKTGLTSDLCQGDFSLTEIAQ